MKRVAVEKKDGVEEGGSQPPHKHARKQKQLESARLYLNKISVLPEEFNEFAFSLSELLESIRPILSIHFNFMIDIDWLLQQYPPSFSTFPMTLVVGSKMGSDSSWLTKEVRTRNLEGVSVCKASLPIPFGTHHTKLSLFESDNAIHVLISTANLIPSDWETKTQLFYYLRAPLHKDEVAVPSSLSTDLSSYLREYNLPQTEYWLNRLKFAYFDECGDRLVYSVPGYHVGIRRITMGHHRLRSLLYARREREAPPKGRRKLLVAQASSIGSLGAKPEAWFIGQFAKSLQGGANEQPRVCLVYPTEADVRGSMVGLAAGSSLPYSRATGEKQPWLRERMCKWRSEGLGRSRAMPHVKTYAQFDSEDRQLEWMLVTSANLSKAAWGDDQKNGTQLMIRSYELGVLICDRSRLLLPYDYPLCQYKKEDTPWYVDVLEESLRE